MYIWQFAVLIEPYWNVKFSGGDWVSGGNSEY